MAQNSIFRKAALDRLSSPEQLDQLLRFAPATRTLLARAAAALRPQDRAARGVRKQAPTVLQMESLECGAAALAMILGYHGRYVPLEELRVACGVSRDGSKASNIVRAARSYGMLAKGFKKEPEQLPELPLPLIAFVNFDHFVVVEGFAPGCVFLNDPAIGPRTISSEEFDQAFTGVALVLTPGPDFKTGGTRPSPLAALRRRLTGLAPALLLTVALSLLLLGAAATVAALLPALVDGPAASPALALGAGLAYAAVIWLRATSLANLEAQIGERGGGELLTHALRLPVAFFSQRQSSEVASRALLNADLGRHIAALIPGALDAVLALGLLGLLAGLEPALAVTAAGAALGALILSAVGNGAGDDSQRLAQDRGKLYGLTYSGIQMIETLQAGGAEADSFTRWAGLQARVISGEQRTSAARYARATALWLLAALGMAATLVVGALKVYEGTLSGGEILAALFLQAAILQPIGRIPQLVDTARSAAGIAGRLDDLLHHPPDPLLTDSGPDSGAQLSGELELRDLTFGYSRVAPPLIEGLSLRLSPGRRVALVGGSGSGKSTVAKLVAGLYEPWSGSILLDGRPRTAWPRAVVTRSLTVVDQEIAIFAGTMRENITLWDDKLPEAAIVRAAKDAAIHEEICARQGGYDSLVEAGGRGLSGGQRQRIEIARALVRDPAILVLDEATSALDPITEQLIDRHLRSRGCACLIVAHRLSTVRDADEILVLDHGRVVQRGTHDELMAAPGPYAALFAAEDDAAPRAQPVPPGQAAADPTSATSAPHPVAPPGELLAACTLVGRALGVEVQQPSAAAAAHREPLTAIADASGLRARRVALRDRWWHEQGPPLLAFIEEGMQPVALLPGGAGGYIMVAPRDPAPVPVTAEVAERLAAFAEHLYRPLPDEPVGGRALLRWGLRGSAGDLRLLLGVGAADGLLGLAAPIAAALVASTLVEDLGAGSLWLLGAALTITVAFAALARLTGAIAGLRLVGRAVSDLQAALWDRLLRQPASFFRHHDPGDLGDMVMGLGEAGRVMAGALAVLPGRGATALCSLLLLAAIDWRLSLVAQAMAVAIGLIAGGLAWAAVRTERSLSRADGRLAALALDLIANVVRLRTAGAEARQLARWAAAVKGRASVVRRGGLLRGAQAATGAATVVAIPAFLIALALLRPDLGASARLAGAIAFAQAILSAGALSEAIIEMVRLASRYERLGQLLRARPQRSDPAREPGELSGEVVLEQVDFGYSPDAPVLRGISLRVLPGELLAIVGPSGSGKSTLLRLLLGFECPAAGRVCYNGRDLADLDARAVRRQVGVVLQHGQLSADDIYHNIVGVLPLGVERAWEAAALAGLDAEIRELPMGMYTVVPEGGSTFSGGQRQRMLIARALVPRPRVILFDEATSALDNLTQRIVSDSLARLAATRVVVAQRLSTVVNADRIVVIDGGRIVQEGTFAELMAHDGLFASLVRRQLI